MFAQEARLCERHPNKLAKTNEEKLLAESEEKVKDNEEGIRDGEVMASTKPRKDISLSFSLDGSKSKNKSIKKSNCKISE